MALQHATNDKLSGWINIKKAQLNKPLSISGNIIDYKG